MGDEPFDVGVLVVHGIGTQSKDTTLRDFVDPVVELLDRLADAGELPEEKPQTRLFSLPQQGLIGVEPPRVNRVDPGRWLIGEAWWADAFDVPKRGEVTAWLVDASPWFAYFYVARLWARFGVRWVHVLMGLLAVAATVAAIASATTSGPAWLGAPAVAAWAAVIAMGATRPRSSAAIVAATVLVVWPLAALATLVMVVGWLVGLVPGSWTARVRSFQVTMARSVGDSFALISSARREEEMLGAITAATESLLNRLDASEATRRPLDIITAAARSLLEQPKAGEATRRPLDIIIAAASSLLDQPDTGETTRRPLVISAHSQGAALTYRLFGHQRFQDLLEGRKVTLVTHGSAILPIHVLECRRDEQAKGWAGVRGIWGLVGLVLLSFTLGRLASGAVSQWTAATATAAALTSGLAFAAVRRDERQTRCTEHRDANVGGGADGQQAVGPAWGTPSGPKPSAPAPQKKARGEEQTDDTGKQALCPKLRVPSGGELRWVDLWAPWDPVPNGPLDLRRPHAKADDPYASLPDESGSRFLPCRVANDHQPWTDHTTYRTNDEDVVSRWIGEIAYRAKGVSPASMEPRSCIEPCRAREDRLVIGGRLLALQGVIVLFGGAAMLARWDELDDLGRWVGRTFPGPLRTVVATAADVIPGFARRALLGTSHDPARFHGFLAGVVVVLGAVVALSLVLAAWQRAASRRFTLKADSPGLVKTWGAVTIFVFLALADAAIYVAAHDRPETDSQNVRVTIRLAGGAALDGVVTFQPLGDESDSAVMVQVGDRGATIYLDRGRRYAISAVAAGGKDCSASFGDTVRVVCQPVGTILEPHR